MNSLASQRPIAPAAGQDKPAPKWATAPLLLFAATAPAEAGLLGVLASLLGIAFAAHAQRVWPVLRPR